MDNTFGVISQNYLPVPGLQRISPVFSFRHFIVFHMTLRSKIHFELIFAYGVYKTLIDVCVYIDAQLFQYHL